MHLIRGLANLQAPWLQQQLTELGGCVATIGNYDGVHIGHQQLLADLDKRGRELSLPTVVILFEPTPAEYFAADQAPARLTRLTEKLPLLALAGVKMVLCLRFDQNLAQFSAAEFVAKILLDGLQLKHLVVGDDFRFGVDRSGDFAYLQQAGQQFGFSVAQHDAVIAADERISSTRIRALLAQGQLGAASALLGRPYSVTGRVVHGDRIGRQLGFPTANILLRRRRSPLAGVYVVMVSGITSEPLAAVANVGLRPTVAGKQARVEVHLLDYSADLYGRRLSVQFFHRIRPEQKFESLQALKAQIAVDVESARLWLNCHSGGSETGASGSEH